jgi:hypothetical protein
MAFRRIEGEPVEDFLRRFRAFGAGAEPIKYLLALCEQKLA